MRVLELSLRRFRGFKDLSIKPKGHVVLLGVPGAGRSDLIEGLSRVLDPEVTRRRIADEFDFHEHDTTAPAEAEVTLGDLPPDLEQHFLDHLELWDSQQHRIVDELETPEEVDQDNHHFALRLCYRAEWSDAEQRVEEFVYYPKTSDRHNRLFDRARVADIAQLEFARIPWGSGRILDLAGRSGFRRLVEHAGGEDFSNAVDQYVAGVAASAKHFSDAAQVKSAIQEVLSTLRQPLRLGNVNAEEMLQFVPEGGAATGLLRSLTPALDLNDGAGLIPAYRHGSTTATLFRVAETLALASVLGGILAIDDLGQGLDSGSATHLASAMQQHSRQAWITTRVPSVAEIFNPDEVFRLSRDSGGNRVLHQGHTAANKVERIAWKHWSRNLLPALSFNAVIVVEGPDDFIALHALSLRLFKERRIPLPASRGVTFVSAAATGSGGSSNVPRLARLASEMGLWSVTLIDWDKTPDAETILQRTLASANSTVRLPEGFAIERALVRGVPDDVLRSTLVELSEAARVQSFEDIGQWAAAELEEKAIAMLKKTSLHGPFVESLPDDVLPPVALRGLAAAVVAAASQVPGLIQL